MADDRSRLLSVERKVDTLGDKAMGENESS
jgi:hypothetical protein